MNSITKSGLSIGEDTVLHTLPANPQTVHWGYFDQSIAPVLTVKSGDLIHVETITHHAGDAPDLLMDETIEEIYRAIPPEQRNPGPHLLTGPIYVQDSKPGDTLEVEILQLTPRFPYGSNLTASWGYLHQEMNEKERVTIYEIDSEGQWLTAKFAYDYPGPYNVNGKIIEPHSIGRVPALQNMQIPVRLHIGTMGVAPEKHGRFSTVPPGVHGGNLDNWRIGAGSTMYYPVWNEGALLSLGDCHLAQGDSELSGTAIETSMNCLIRVKVRKDCSFSSPLLETSSSWITHGFDPDLNLATRKASLEMLKFLQQHYGLSREDAYSFISVAADFSITQVVDELQGVHVSIPKKAALPKK
ncbi:acetamidase/formamidase family protein [Bacillus massiliglaciei]|uniref:acetamidase/formamidase family protein n=1 Tax=Bacillus massiliglaciei TaxID=1816693 RepID=UPI000AE84DC2|nr:acetamidase/formamidase family protein [Bacillus massiliglaciei]